MRRVWLVLSIAMIVLLSGCGWNNKSVSTTDNSNIATLNYKPDFNYIKVPQTPTLITDRLGYEPTGKKVVYLISAEARADYAIVDVDSEEVIYEGSMTRMDLPDEEMYLYVGDFSDYSREGTYRVLHNDVGYSYPFKIEKNLYMSMYKDTYNRIASARYTRTGDLIFVLSNLMMTKDIYSESYIDEAFIRKSIEELLKCQDEETGAVYDLLQTDVVINGQESLSTTAEFAGIMAQYYLMNREEMTELTAECIKAANKAFTYMDSYRDNVSSDSYHFAAAQMYRATGEYKYRNALAWYDQMDKELHDISQYDYTMLANVAYLKSNVKVDYNRCEGIMNAYLNDMVKLSEKTDKLHFYVQSDIAELTQDEIINNMMKLGFVAYVVSGREYASIQANYIHYLLGANENLRDYMLEGADGMPIGEDILELSKMIFVLGSEYEV